MRHCDSRPARHGAHRGDVQHDLERLLGNEEVQHNTEEANHTGQQNTCHRNAGAGHLGGELRCRTCNTHRVEDTAGGVQASVQRGSSRGNNDQLHNRCGTVNTNRVEEGHERRLCILVRGVGHEQAEQNHGTNVEDRDTPDHGVDSAGDNLLNVLGFTTGGADQLNTGVGEHNALNHDKSGKNAVGEEAVIGCDEFKAGADAVDGFTEDQVPDTYRHEGQQGKNLNECEPEFQLTEELHGDEVQSNGDNNDDECAEPLGNICEELVVSTEPADVDSDSGGVCNGGHCPVQPVQPSGYECGLFAVEFAGVGDEGARGRAVKDQLAEGSKNQVAEEADDGVDDGEHGACVLQAATGAQEQAGTNCGTDGDHLELTCAKPLVEAFLFVCERVICGGLSVLIRCRSLRVLVR